MWRSQWILAWGSAPVFLCAVLALGHGSAEAAPAGKAHPSQEGSDSEEPAPRTDQLLARFDPRKRELVDGRLVASLGRGKRAMLTLDPALDSFVAKLLKQNEVPYAGVVAIEPSTGRVLAYVSHSSAEPNGPDQVLEATAPAASVFKLVTTSALLNEGFPASRNTCYHGGSSRLTLQELVDNARLDKACASLTGALGYSINTVFGKLALKHLNQQKLTRQAHAYGFGTSLPFDVKTQESALDVPRDRLEFARTAAGFWHSQMSPLHGAALAASIANRGRMMRPTLVESVQDAKGRVLFRRAPTLYRRSTGPAVAAQLATMMRATVDRGTSRRAFHDRRGRPLLPNIEVAGKTGTLSRERPYRGYTWWVGFAPADDPKIALAVLTVNTPKWRIKASQVAAATLRHYLVEKPRPDLEPVARGAAR